MRSGDPLPRLARLIATCAADAGLDAAERDRRDADIARELDPASSPQERIDRWLTRVSPSSERGVEVPLGAAGTVSILAGAGLGLLSAVTLFYYDGSGRVNALAVMGFLTAFPVLLLALSWLSCLSITGARVWPVLGSLVAGLARLSPGRLTAWLAARMSRDELEHLKLLAPREGADPPLQRVRVWFFARWSHLVGTGYFAGALIGMFLLVVFSDLVFGWSTTLEIESGRLYRLVELMALPWAWIWPAASPSQELVAASQYFRAAAPVEDVEKLAALGQWWPFLLMSVLTYGWLPRAVSAALCARLLHRASARAFVASAASRHLLERLSAPPGPAAAGLARQSRSSSPARDELSASRVDVVVNWAQLAIDDDVLRATFGAHRIESAGGVCTIDEDDAVVAAVSEGATTVVLCKAWEPPLLELHDFAAALHARSGASVYVVPVVIEGGRPGAPAPRDAEVWSRSFSVSGVTLTLDGGAFAVSGGGAHQQADVTP
ncbi:MAG: DUF2868 domain-containing protein [Pseudomonadota bacterium]